MSSVAMTQQNDRINAWVSSVHEENSKEHERLVLGPDGSIKDALKKVTAIRDNNNTSIVYIVICHRDLFMNEDVRQATIDLIVETILHADVQRNKCVKIQLAQNIAGLYSKAFEQRLFQLSVEQSKMMEEWNPA
jgi:hypothetical protein